MMTDDEVGRIFTWNGRYLLVIETFYHHSSERPADAHAVAYYRVFDMEDGLECEVSRRRALLVFRRLA